MLKFEFCLAFLWRFSAIFVLSENVVEHCDNGLNLEPEFTDLWGYKVNWTDPKEGWDGEKRRWIKEIREETVKQSVEVEQYTELGYKKMKIPKHLHELILSKRNLDKIYPEDCPRLTICDEIQNGRKIQKEKTQIILLDDKIKVKTEIAMVIKRLIEEWTNVHVRGESRIYGIRRYLNGTWLGLHIDHMPTHMLSAILQIDQKVDEDWPLYLIDLKGQRQTIYLKPGEMVLYESAKVPHGRQKPLNGSFYDNIFVHFAPIKRSGYVNQSWKNLLLKSE